MSGFVHDDLGDHAGRATLGSGYDIGSITEGLVAYYPLDGDVNDATELGNDGTNNGATFNGSGTVGSDSLSFDGSNDYVQISDNPSLQFGTGSYTVSLWANFNTTGSYHLVSKWDGSGSLYRVLRMATDGTFRFYHSDGSNVPETQSSTTVSTSQWYHSVGVRDTSSNELRLYVNGVLEDTVSDSAGDISTTHDQYLGGRNGGNYHDGLVDDVRIYDRALSPIEIEVLANRNNTSPITADDTI